MVPALARSIPMMNAMRRSSRVQHATAQRTLPNERLTDPDPGPVFREMHSKRLATYTTFGFDVPTRR